MHPEFNLGAWSISTYFLIISLDFCLLFLLLPWRAKTLGLSPARALDVGLVGTVAGFIGARAFHVFYEGPSFYWSYPLEALKLWQGGFVVLPGILTGVLAGALWLVKREKSLWPWFDLFAPLMALGYGLGRWACFFQGCCYGIAAEAPWGLHFETHIVSVDSVARLPIQAITSLTELAVFGFLMLLERRKLSIMKPGMLFSLWMVGHGVNRMIMEVFRDDPRGPLVGAFGISFWGAGVLVLMGGFLWGWRLRK